MAGDRPTIPRRKHMGKLADPETGAPIEAAEADHFYRCEACSAWVDRRESASCRIRTATSRSRISLRLTTKGTVRYVGLLRPGRQIDLAMQLDRPLRRSRHGTESAGI